MSAKDCGHHDDRKRLLRAIFAGVIIILFVVLLVVVLIWAILRPSKPSFTLQDATVYSFNITASPTLLTSNIGLTLLSRNPNDRIGIYYDRLEVYGLYRDQQITLRTGIHPFYQGHDENNVWSPFISGDSIPIAPYNGVALGQDQSSGVLLLTVKINGRIRWKVGSFISGGYHLHATCPALIGFGGKGNGVVVDKGIKYQLVQKCSVSV